MVQIPRCLQRFLPRCRDRTALRGRTRRRAARRRPTMERRYTYEEVLAVSRKTTWEVEDLIGGARQLDFERPFLPESLARVDGLAFLTAGERRTLNQIRGHAYLRIFDLVEEFILPFVMDHVRPYLPEGESARVRALLQFAGEEAKHIDLFRRFGDAFTAGFGTACAVIGPPTAVARAVLDHHPLAVALAILQIEWMTQRHYLDSVREDTGLDAQFSSLLRHHWQEEAQHAKLDTLVVETLAAGMSPEALDRAFDEYLAIGGILDAGLGAQIDLDIEALERATDRILTAEERAELVTGQRQANRWTYLGSGMTHPNFLATVAQLRPAARARLEEVAPAFC